MAQLAIMAAVAVAGAIISRIFPEKPAPRLTDMAVSTSTNGQIVPFGYGNFRVGGNVIWSPGFIAQTQVVGGKGTFQTNYNYYASFAAAFGQGVASIVRVWGDTKVIYEAGGPTYFPSKYFFNGYPGYQCGVCGSFVDNYGNVIEAVWFGHGFTYTVPAGATALQLGINNNYQAITSGGFNLTCSVAGGQTTTAFVPSTAVPWEVVGTQNASFPFGNVGGTAPVLALANLTPGQSITVAAQPQPGGGYYGRITVNASVGTNALGYSTGQNVVWYGPDGDTNQETGGNETAPPASIYPAPTCYSGTEQQDPDPTIQANMGVANTPAFRGLCYAVWDDFPIANFGDRIPTIRAEIAFNEAPTQTVVTPAQIVQQAFARWSYDEAGAYLPVTLPAPPTPGNTLIFIYTGYWGPDAPDGLTQISGAQLTPAWSGFEGPNAWKRVVETGDSATWNFTKPGGGGPWNLAVWEILSSDALTITAISGTYSGSSPTTSTLNPDSSALILSQLFIDSTAAILSVSPAPYAIQKYFIGSDDPGMNAVAVAGEGPGLPDAAISWTVFGNPSVNCIYVIVNVEGTETIAVPVPAGRLDGVVEDICLRAGLTSDQIDVTRLVGQTVIGYVVGRLTTAQQALQPLATGFFFDGAEIDGVLTFIPRGQQSLMLIPESDLGLREDKAEYTESFGQEQDLPRMVQVLYADPAIDYQQNKQARLRSAKVVKTRNRNLLELPFALDSDSAMQIAEKALYLAYLERRPFEINLWMALYNLITPTDVIEFVGRGVTMQVRVVSTTEGQGRTIKLKCVSEMPNIYLSSATAGPTMGYVGGGQAPLITATLYLFDIPLLRDSDANPAGTGYYFGLAAAAGFAGAILDTSTDDSNFAQESQAPSAVTYGTALNILGAEGNGSPAGQFSPWVLDTANTLELQLALGSLANATEAQLTAMGSNALLVGNEVIQFETATQNEDGSWTVSNLLRGRRGTDGQCGRHVASETVIVLNVAGLVRVGEPNTILNILRYYRAVASGQTVDAVASVDFTVTGNDLKPYSPVAIGGSTDAGGDWTISWYRRTRYGGVYGTGALALVDGLGGPVNEEVEEYEIDILGGSPLGVVRTLTVYSPSCVYPSDMQVADFGCNQTALEINVYQISATVGRGFVGSCSLPQSTTAPVVLPSGGSFYIN